MEFKIAATAAGGAGVCARTGNVTNAARNAVSNIIRNDLITFPYNTIEKQSQEILPLQGKKTDAAR
jgi:hypothetical protein